MTFFQQLDHLTQQDRLLLEAVEQQDLAAVQQQLAAGANPSAADHTGLSALQVAAATGQGPVVEALLAAGARVSATAYTNTCSFWARGGGDVTYSRAKYHNFTPLAYMVKYMSISRSTRLALYKGGGIGRQLHQCSAGCTQMAAVVQQLVAAGARMEVWGGSRTPLHYAAEAGCSTVVAALLQAGAKADSTTPTGWSVLHEAASSGSCDVVQQLLGAVGPSRAAGLVKVLGREGPKAPLCSPLHLAAAGGHLGVAEALVAAGADKEQQDSNWTTPLLHALLEDHHHLVPLLVTPATANRRWPRDPSPLLRVARYRWRHGVVAQHPQWKQRLAAAAAKAAAALLAAGADADVEDEAGCTPLTVAAAWGHPQVLQVLLEYEVQQQRRRPRQQQAQQQQQQQQQQVKLASSSQVPPDLLQQLGAHALRGGNGPTWHLLLTLAADTGGVEGARNLWSALKKQQQQPEPGVAGPQASTLPQARPRGLLRAWFDCWAAACRGLADHRSKMTGRLEQLVIHPHQQRQQPQQQQQQHHHHHHHQQQQQQQQQQGSCAEAGRVSQGPRLARNLDWLLHRQQEQLPPATTAAADSASGSSTAPAVNTPTTAVDAWKGRLQTAATSGNEEAVRAALEESPNKAAGLWAAAPAAARAGHWGLCMVLLRELVMLDEAKGRAALQAAYDATVGKAASIGAFPGKEEEEDDEWRLRVRQQQLQAAVQVCDAVYDDWLALRQQKFRELHEAVVAAAEAATAAAFKCHGTLV